jgi:hypothetical protein
MMSDREIVLCRMAELMGSSVNAVRKASSLPQFGAEVVMRKTLPGV